MTDKPNKYLFDLNNFDDPNSSSLAQEEEEDLPVVYSEEELEAAKAAAFQEGKQQGLSESAASREQYVSQLIQKISTTMQQFTSGERQRSDVFEKEVVLVCHAAIEKALPLLAEKYGRDELAAFILETLQHHENSSNLVVYLNPEDLEDVKKMLNEGKATFIGDIDFEPNEAIGVNSCKISWKDGGAVKDMDALIQEICDKLRSPLAPEDENKQNETNNDAVVSDESK